MSDFPKRILHADDDPMIQEIVERAFRGYEGLSFETCSNGQELIEKVNAFNPELILLDATMPGMNGADIIEKIRNLDEPIHAPIIFFTGHKDLKMIDAYAAIGVIGIIHKPISPGLLPERVRYFWEYRQKKPSEITDEDV